MFDGAGMSTASYGAPLSGWEAQPNTPTGNSPGAQRLTYCDTDMAREQLTGASFWTITGDTRDCRQAPLAHAARSGILERSTPPGARKSR